MAGLPTALPAVDFSLVPGVKLDYQPLTYDGGYNAPRVFISDPEIVVLSNGNYIASHALAGRSSGSDSSGLTSLFRSADKGATWTSLGSKTGILRGSLFVHDGALYLLGANNDVAGNTAVVMKSTDNGTSWTTAAFTQGGPVTPNNPVVWSNRLWSADGVATFSALTTNNLLTPASWTLNIPYWPPSPAWVTGITEGQIVASPELGVFILPTVIGFPYTALARVNSSGGSLFDTNNFVALPGGEKKFGATYDAVSGKFFVLSNPILPVHTNSIIAANMIRNTAAVLSSRDLLNWKVEKIFLYSTDIDRDGFGYLNFDFDTTNMVVAARTAFPVGSDDPNRGHDSNLLTFHRIDDFRNLLPDHFLKISGNQVLRYERTQYQDAPLGSFALGSTFAGAALTTPSGMGKTASGDVYIQESGGRILHFDAAGNFIETNSSSPVAFQATDLNDVLPVSGECAWVCPGSGDWFSPVNWYYWGRPDTTEEMAVFGSAATSAVTINIPSASQTWAFNTDGEEEGWGASDVNKLDLVATNGVLQGTAKTNSLIYIFKSDRFFYGSTVPEVRIRLRADANCKVDLYWTTPTADAYASVRSINGYYTNNGAFQDIVFALAGNTNWDGQAITRLRLDPQVHTNATRGFAIDSITVPKETHRVKGLRFRNANPYTLSGGGQLRIQANNATCTVAVLQGRHTNDVALILGSNTDINLTNNTSLHLKQGINLNGKTLHVSGSGRLMVQGDLVMNGGTLAVDGTTPLTFTNNSTGSVLNGTLQLVPESPFSPSIGTSFDLLDNQSLLSTNKFTQISLPALPEGMQWNTDTLYSSGNILVESIPKISIPFVETFEGITAGSSLLVSGNTNGWYGSTNTSAFITNFSYAWSNVFYPAQGAAHTKVLQYSEASLTALFETNAAPVNITVDFMFSDAVNSVEPDMSLVAGHQTAFYVDTSGLLNVWHGLDNTGTNNVWLTYTNTPIGPADWARVTIEFDYTTDVLNGNRFFKVMLNGVELRPAANGYIKGSGVFNADTNGTWLLTANPVPIQIQSLGLKGAGRLDDLVVTTAAVTNFLPQTNGSCTLTGGAIGNGTVSPSSTNVLSGGSANFVITAASYYRIASLATNGTDTGLSFDNNSTATNFSWSNVRAAGTLTATFTAQVTADPANTPYWWLAQYGLTNFNTDAVADVDGDRLLSWQEYIAGTDPTNSSSVVKITGVGINAQGTVIRWSSISNRSYSLGQTTNLLKTFTVLAGASNLPATPPENVFTSPASGGNLSFYRINVQK